MATFEAQVEGLTSLTIDGSSAPTQDELTQFLTDGAKEVINSLPPNLLPLCASSVSFTSGSASTLNTGKILNVFRNDGDINQPCRKIPPKQKGRVSDPEDMAYATITDPVYYIDNNSLDVLPSGGSCTYSEVKYPSVGYRQSSIGTTSLTGVTATAADPTVFTKASHGLATGDVVELSDFTEMTEINGMIGTVTSLNSSTFEVDGISADPAETTGGAVTKLGGFPDEAEHLVVLYGAVKSLQNVLGNKTVSLNNSDAISVAFTAINTELDKIVTDVHVPVAPAINTISYTDVTAPSKADISGDVPTYTKPVFTSSSAFLTEMEAGTIGHADSDIDAEHWFSIAGQLIEDNEDVELASAHLQKISTFINAYQVDIQNELNEFNKENARYQANVQAEMAKHNSDLQVAIANGNKNMEKLVSDNSGKIQKYSNELQSYQAQIGKLVQSAQGYINEVQSRLQVHTAQYGWYEKQQAKLQADYDKGLQALS